MKETAAKLIEIKERIDQAILKLKLTEEEIELDMLETETQSLEFWNDPNTAKDVMQKVNSLKQIISPWRKAEKEASELLELISTNPDLDLQKEINVKTTELEENLRMREMDTYFSGKYDERNAILSIYAGAGGVDAQDWAEMLLSMYLKFSERKEFSASIISSTPGTEAGIKSASVEIIGPFAYGTLKSERGVHRLVRISPYDADKARHTSFALVEVIPEIEDASFDIPETELRVETFRASGHGGQSVNTTDSAVRVTHLPTNTVVICQNERSQLQNKTTAIKVLKARLKVLHDAEREKELKVIRGENLSAEWGSQIRSYVIHPYQMVKDHRTNTETSDTDGVLNGKLDLFIDAYLKNPS